MREETNMSNKIILFLVTVFLLATAAPGIGAAQETAQNDSWKFTLSPYMWGTGLKGSTAIGQKKQDVDLGFSDILDALDIGAMVDFRAEKERWSIGTNFLWVDLEDDADIGLLKVEIKPTLWIVELDGDYRLTDNWKLRGGIRYYELDIDIDFSGAETLSIGGSKEWADPFVGVGFSAPLSERWSFAARGDIGGFGAGSDFSWQLWGLLEYRFGKQNSVALGWRYLDFDYQTGSGNINFEIDTYLSGPIAGVRIRF